MQLPHAFPLLEGRIKRVPEHFRVREEPAYEPSGTGDHVFVEVTKRDLTTPYLLKELAPRLGVSEGDIGVAGLKDRRAVTTQRLSLPAGCRWQETPELEGLLSWTVLGHHEHKLKRGHLRGNHFDIEVHCQGSPEPAVGWLEVHGWANYFGAQRFGREDNVAAGRDVLSGRWRGPRWKRSLMISAWQSDCFNRCLDARIQAGLFERIVEGDLCKKLDSGGEFWAEDLAAEQARLERFELSPTGPLPGWKMRRPRGAAGLLEAPYASLDEFPKQRLDGTRRMFRLPLQSFSWETTADGCRFQFFLPAGSYATTLLGHIFTFPEESEASPEEPDLPA